MKMPNATKNDWPATSRHLRRLIEDAGISQQEAARRLGINPRTMRRYLSQHYEGRAPYSVVYALEALAKLRS